MLKLINIFLTANRKRRYLAISATIWLLRLIYDIEMTELHSYSNKFDEFNSEHGNVSQRDYTLAEEGCCNCEHSIAFLDCAIVDLGFAYYVWG